jgi:hypothetical protein
VHQTVCHEAAQPPRRAPLTGTLGYVKRIQGLPAQGFSAGQHVVEPNETPVVHERDPLVVGKNAQIAAGLGQQCRRIYGLHMIRSNSVLDDDKRESHGCQIQKILIRIIPGTPSGPSAIQTSLISFRYSTSALPLAKTLETVTPCRRQERQHITR